jgi:YidC/Oxa1 family membrane protein insertase
MMEEKKFDKNSIIGFGLIFLIVMWMMYNSQQAEQKEQAEKAKQAQVDKQKKAKEVAVKEVAAVVVDTVVNDTVKKQKLQGALGIFAYSASLPTAKEGYTVLENDLVKLTISNKGGYVSEAILKKYEKFSKGSGQLVELIKNNNANFNLALQTKDNRVLNTKDLFFEPTFKQVGENKVLSMKLKTGATTFLEYNYTLKPNDYMVDFDLRSQGLSTALNSSKETNLEWDLKTYRNEKSINYENQNAEVYFEYEEGKIDYVSQGSDQEETPENASLPINSIFSLQFY